MRFLDIGPEATGFIAIGQFATGFFAIGQVAHGVVAVGQLAVGAFAFGQGAVGLVSVGMGGVGIFWTGAMVGVGGHGFGGVVRLAPAPGPPPELEPTTTWETLRADGGDGWVATDIDGGCRSRLALPVGTRVHARLRRSLQQEPEGRVLVHVSNNVVGRVLRVPMPRWKRPRWWGIWLCQFALLVGVCALYVWLAVFPWLFSMAMG
jgi:hypothetical protein